MTNTHLVRLRGYDWEVLKSLARHTDRTVQATLSTVLREWLEENATKQGFDVDAINRIKRTKPHPKTL